jgi:hypothetical protein
LLANRNQPRRQTQRGHNGDAHTVLSH